MNATNSTREVRDKTEDAVTKRAVQLSSLQNRVCFDPQELWQVLSEDVIVSTS